MIGPTGVVLAGGRSSRFGSEKALANFSGRLLLESVLDELRPWTSVIAVNANLTTAVAARARDLDLDVLPDLDGLPDGPLSGVLTALEWSHRLGATQLISLPCDVVSIPSDAISRLLADASADRASYAVTPDGPQNLCAVWPTRGIEILTAALAGGRHPPVRSILEAINAVPVFFADKGSFLNINTTDDLARAEAVVRAGAVPET